MTTTTLPARAVVRVRATSRAAPRTDIQALRALAVTLVLVYHLVPDRLTGGFVGVDVFFVVSGFLITAHLLTRPPASGADLARFWSRRIRRLLPASLLVLAVTLVASRAVAPETQWANTARQAGAAALYVVNWLLAADSVDYLAATNAPTPVQHFWSLSVEEQFYFVWPVLVGALAFLAVRRRWRRAVLAGLVVVVAVSLTFSIVATVMSPASAYFITPTRAWEFGLGGVLAAVVAERAGRPADHGSVRLTGLGRSVLAAIGLLAITLAALTYHAGTPFPGWQALLPTLGTVAVLAAVPTAEVGRLGRVLAAPVLQWLGDISYSVYLWHWPLIVLVPHVTGGHLGLIETLGIAGATLVLAALTKHFVEDRFRYPPPNSPTARVFWAAGLGMAVVLCLSGLQLAEVAQRDVSARRQLTEAVAADDPCFGAGSLLDPERCRDNAYRSVVPAPAQAGRDKAALYPDVSGGPDCWSAGPRFPVRTCTFGDPAAERHLALVGNSHAGQWLPALEEVARRDGWRITTYVASRCAMVPTDQTLPTAGQTRACRRWVDDVSAAVRASDYDLVVLANRMSVTALGSAGPEASRAAYRRGYVSLLRTWSEAGVATLAVRDTPAPGDGRVGPMPDCVAANAGDLTRCSGPRATWEPAEPLAEAIEAVRPAGVVIADLNDLICEPEICRGVVGGVLVFYDGSHLTATYARTLATPLAEQMRDATRAR